MRVALKHWAGVWAVCIASVCLADSSFQVKFNRLRYGAVMLEGFLIDLKNPRSLELALGRLSLPLSPWPIDRLTVSCQDSRIGPKVLACPRGRLKIHLPDDQDAALALALKLTPGKLRFQLTGEDLSLRNPDFTRAVEQLKFSLQLEAKQAKERLGGRLMLEIAQGEALYLPIYFPFREHPVRLKADFSWDSRKSVLLGKLHLLQNQVLEAEAFAEQERGALSRFFLRLQGDLPALFGLYGHPFLAGSTWEGIELTSGKLHGRLRIADGHAAGMLQLERATVTDQERRLGLDQLNARLSWQAAGHPPPSSLSWQAGHVYAIPLGRAEFLFSASGDTLRLLSPAEISILDGRLIVDQLEALELKRSPKIRWRGRLDGISLTALSQALKWPPLKGRLTGEIPQTTYDVRQNTLALQGQLKVQAFSGMLVIEQLKITDLFGALPRLEADIRLHALDLGQLSERFAFGRITGSLEGYIRGLQLENWRPVAFDAWFGTPPQDRTRHLISQQAVKNLADLGGGFAADILSRALLRVFDQFSYRALGLGCRLENGICQLSGIAPATQGYYIVTGAGLPRIEVIGYNRRIDWRTLVARLARIVQFQLTPART